MNTRSLFLALLLLLSFGVSACDTKDQAATPASENTPAMEEETSQVEEETSNSDLKRYGIESGSVTYELGGAQSGTKTVTWKDWGMTERTEKTTSLTTAGITIDSNEVSIMKGDFMYSYDPASKTGTKLKNTILDDIASNHKNKDLGEIGIAVLEAAGGTKTGTETVAGESCDVYTVSATNTTTCIWNGVPLSVGSDFAGLAMSETATSISTDTPDDNLFEIPGDVSFQDLGDVGDLLKNL